VDDFACGALSGKNRVLHQGAQLGRELVVREGKGHALEHGVSLAPQAIYLAGKGGTASPRPTSASLLMSAELPFAFWFT
jgi:hypothetical protein